MQHLSTLCGMWFGVLEKCECYEMMDAVDGFMSMLFRNGKIGRHLCIQINTSYHRTRKEDEENENEKIKIYIFLVRTCDAWSNSNFHSRPKRNEKKKNKQKSKWQYANESLQRLCRFYFVSDTHSFEESEKEKKEKNIVQVPIYMSTKIICQFPLNNHSSYVHQHSRRIEKEKKEKYSLKLCHDSMPNETTTNYVCAVRSLCSRIERCQSE